MAVPHTALDLPVDPEVHITYMVSSRCLFELAAT